MFNVYPTISSGQKIVIEMFFSKPLDEVHIEFLDVNGFVMWVEVLEDLNGYRIFDWLPPSHMSGVYLLRLKSQHAVTSTKKVVITR